MNIRTGSDSLEDRTEHLPAGNPEPVLDIIQTGIPGLVVPIRLSGLFHQTAGHYRPVQQTIQTEQQAGLNGHQDGQGGIPGTGQAQTGLTEQAGYSWPVSDDYRPGRYDDNGLNSRPVKKGKNK